MVAVHSYRPNWPDELELSAGDVILVLSKHEEERWFGRLQSGQRGYFPPSCVMELSQVGGLEGAQHCSVAALVEIKVSIGETLSFECNRDSKCAS